MPDDEVVTAAIQITFALPTRSRPTPARLPMQKKRPEYILWIEGFGFGLMLVFTWLTEILRVPQYLFAEPWVTNWNRPLLRTVIIVAVWAAVHIATRRLLRRLHHLEEYLRICAWCKKMDLNGQWVTMEDYLRSAFATQASHGVCPDCSRKLKNPGTRAPMTVERSSSAHASITGHDSRRDTSRPVEER